MTDYVWKHLPYAIYLDTNALRSAGTNLDKPWISELLSITNQYGIEVGLSELVLDEWCEHLISVLKGNRQKFLSSMSVLRNYDISVPDIEPEKIIVPKKENLFRIVSQMMKSTGFSIIPNWDATLSRLLDEAVSKKPPFQHGGKGLCDAVILESYAEHAKKSFEKARVLVISNDDAVKRSGSRFKDRGIAVAFVGESEIVEKLKSLLKDEVAAYIESRKVKLKTYILGRESEILDFVRKAQLEITDWKINPPLGEYGGEIYGTIESILAVRPLGITEVIGGAPTYGEKMGEDRYPVKITVEIELEIIVNDHGIGLRNLLEPKAIATVQPDTLDNQTPVSMEKKNYYWKPREIVKTIKRDFTVFATLDDKQEKNGVFEDLRMEKVY
ncbi:PIN domain-containing protein [uncultured Desulfosarcina sp.]|uniref:PIN domain-containing protein n=1 Tax=uncultured Desulfosarcina sp. TaxID=218289 RepID=UPI0029C73314|nr:PIN domain-containing protein [uncultured Desulfosarcina sp.]